MSLSFNVEWKSAREEYEVKQLPRVNTKDHPLKAVIVTERIPRRVLSSQPSTGRTTPVTTPSMILEPLSMALEGVDPLTAFAIEEMDPLSKLAAEESTNPTIIESRKSQEPKRELDSWTQRKSAILSKFTTSEKISIVTSFLSDGEKVVVKAQSTAVDKVQHRLEQLDCIEEGSQTKLDLSQNEYINRIELLNRELVSAWNSEQRVKALKIAIQCSKLLADISVLPFYPSKFVLITDILDVFGQLVYNRLRNKTDSFKQGNRSSRTLPENFTPEMVSDSAKETCLNWFYKIASIRELVPRLFVEMALVKCYLFLSTNDCKEAMSRISQMIYGIANPLVAVYARCYLSRIAQTLPIDLKTSENLAMNFYEFLQSYPQIFSRSVKADLLHQKVSLSTYMTLFTPALDYMLQSVAHNANPIILLDDLLDRCKSQGNSSLILNTIMSAFKPAIIANRALQFLEMIENCQDHGIQVHSLLRTLGLCVTVASPPLEHRRQILNIVWKHVGNLTQPENYISCAEPWVVFVVKYFSYREINAILGDIIDHIAPDRSHELYYNQLKYIVENLVNNVQDFESLLVMDNFLPLIDLFQQESVRVEVCKKVLTCTNTEHFINDPVVVNALMFLCATLHDSVNALTPEDEYRQIGDILCQVIKTIDYGRDFEQQLTFYVEARGMFSAIDIVFVQLVQCVNALSVNTRQIVKGQHTRKTSDFVRACAAYCFITIPAIKSVKHRLRLYLLSGQVALFNQCLGQADACFKAALTNLSELQNEELSEAELIGFIKQFVGLLLVVPDNPDCSVLNLTRALLNLVQSHSWQTNVSIIVVYLSVVDLLSVMAQEWYPYHVDKVESNDSLYGSDPKFLAEINKMCSVVVGEIIAKLQTLEASKKQAYLAVELLVKLALRNDLSGQTVALSVNLWNLALRNSLCDKRYLIKTKSYLKNKSFSCKNIRLKELVEKLE